MSCMREVQGLLCTAPTVPVGSLAKSCSLSSSDCQVLGMQEAVASNTLPLVQRNIRAGAMRVSQRSTPAAVTFSPCGRQVAWTQANTLRVEDRQARREVLSQPVPELTWRNKISFSPDSSYLAVAGFGGMFAASLASGVLAKLPCPAGMSTPFEQCSWAPSAQSMALFMEYPFGFDSALSLYTRSGAELLMVHHLRLPRFQRLVWAANSRVLAMMGLHDIFMLDTVSLDLVRMRPPGEDGTIPVAWSPQSWDTPHLLCITQDGVALFYDQKGEVKGRGQHQMQDAPANDMLWGEHGVIVLTRRSLWLFDAASRPSGPVLNCRRVVMAPALTRPMLSPDQVHVCMLQERGGSKVEPHHYDLVILNILLESQAIISLPSPQAAAPVCSWTSRGYSLAVTLVMYMGPAKRHLYNMFSFVF